VANPSVDLFEDLKASNVCGVDVGGNRVFVSTPSQVYTLKREDFVSFKWCPPGTAIFTESTTVAPRVADRASLAQLFTVSDLNNLLDFLESTGSALYTCDNRLTLHAVNDIVALIQRKDPRVVHLHDADLFWRPRTDANPNPQGLKEVGNKLKSDYWESRFILEAFRLNLLEFTEFKGSHDPDAEQLPAFEQHVRAIREASNKTLNYVRQFKTCDLVVEALEERMPGFIPAIDRAEKLVMESDDPGAVALRDLGVFPLPRYKNSRGNVTANSIQYHNLSSLLRATWALNFDGNGIAYPCGFNTIKRTGGLRGCRRRSGVAGAVLHHDIMKNRRKELLLEQGLIDAKTNLKDREVQVKINTRIDNEYSRARKQASKEVLMGVRFLSRVFRSVS
jgi:hypothetical protein